MTSENDINPTEWKILKVISDLNTEKAGSATYDAIMKLSLERGLTKKEVEDAIGKKGT